MRVAYTLIILAVTALFIYGLGLDAALTFSLIALILACDTRYVSTINAIALSYLLKKEKPNDNEA